MKRRLTYWGIQRHKASPHRCQLRCREPGTGCGRCSHTVPELDLRVLSKKKKKYELEMQDWTATHLSLPARPLIWAPRPAQHSNHTGQNNASYSRYDILILLHICYKIIKSKAYLNVDKALERCWILPAAVICGIPKSAWLWIPAILDQCSLKYFQILDQCSLKYFLLDTESEMMGVN